LGRSSLGFASLLKRSLQTTASDSLIRLNFQWMLLLKCRDGSRSIFFDPDRVGSAIYGLGWVPLKMSNFSIFFLSDQKKSLQIRSKSTWIKGRSASYLLWVKSKLGSGWVRAHLYFNGNWDINHWTNKNKTLNWTQTFFRPPFNVCLWISYLDYRNIFHHFIFLSFVQSYVRI